MSTKTNLHVVLGEDKEGKPRAAVIPAADLDTAHRAAASLGLKIGRAETPEASKLAETLPKLKVFVSGKGLVPIARRETYDELVKCLVPVPAISSSAPQSTARPQLKPTDPQNPAPTNLWDAVKVADVVLVRDPGPGKDRGWWECVVQSATKDGKLLSVRFLMYPTDRPFMVKRSAVAILPPSIAAKASKR